MAKRILVVEDEQDVADLVADVLELEGYEVRVGTGETAVQDAAEFRAHVVLLDLMMPLMDGFDVARRLRGQPETQGIPIVVMTAMHDAPTRAEEVGTGYFLAKPFDITELLEAVERATVPVRVD